MTKDIFRLIWLIVFITYTGGQFYLLYLCDDPIDIRDIGKMIYMYAIIFGNFYLWRDTEDK